MYARRGTEKAHSTPTRLPGDCATPGEARIRPTHVADPLELKKHGTLAALRTWLQTTDLTHARMHARTFMRRERLISKAVRSKQWDTSAAAGSHLFCQF
jgi:hypothetical protein